jgi:hypothetical protein
MICRREQDARGYWICHFCESLWTDMLAQTGWLPSECPEKTISEIPHEGAGEE